jgi:hypothetical protein
MSQESLLLPRSFFTNNEGIDIFYPKEWNKMMGINFAISLDVLEESFDEDICFDKFFISFNVVVDKDLG